MSNLIILHWLWSETLLYVSDGQGALTYVWKSGHEIDKRPFSRYFYPASPFLGIVSGALTSKENKAVDIDKESFVLWPF